MDAQLYLPKEWTDDRERFNWFHTAETIQFQINIEITVDLLDRALARFIPIAIGRGRCRIWAESGVLQAVEARELHYVITVMTGFAVRLVEEVQKLRMSLPKQSSRPQEKGAPVLVPSWQPTRPKKWRNNSRTPLGNSLLEGGGKGSLTKEFYCCQCYGFWWSNRFWNMAYAVNENDWHCP